MAQLLIIVLLLIGTGVGGSLYLYPAWNDFVATRKEANYLARISSEFDALLGSRDALLAVVNSISKENLNRIETALPRGQHAAEFLVFLESTIKAHGVEIKKIDLSGMIQKNPDAAHTSSASSQPRPASTRAPIEKESPFQELPVSLDISGTYESFKSFLEAIEKNARLIDIENITFNAPETASEQIEFSIRLKTYYQ